VGSKLFPNFVCSGKLKIEKEDVESSLLALLGSNLDPIILQENHGCWPTPICFALFGNS
jgi:hypothetical protein